MADMQLAVSKCVEITDNIYKGFVMKALFAN